MTTDNQPVSNLPDPSLRQLLSNLHHVTGRFWVSYGDPAWPPRRSGFAPDDPALALTANAHARPFADLSRFDKSEIVHDFIP
jgi:hypothetical protein